MAYTTINKSSDYFNTVLYEGNGATGRGITGVGHQPDFVWIKNRDATTPHVLTDAVRGATVTLNSNDNSVDDTISNGLTAFGTDGFTIGGNGSFNYNNESFVSWNWKAGGGQGSSNTDGSINTTYTSVNTTAGFSISKYTGNGTNNATFGHGLGVAPKIMIGKCTGNTNSWQVTGNVSPLVENKYLSLDTSNAMANSTNVTFDASATTIKLQGGQGTNVSGQPHIAYCFAEKQGFSKFGSYTGNGNADGTFVYTGFKPAFLMIKCTDLARSWQIHNSKSSPFNTGNTDARLFANLVDAEAANSSLDLLSNGFKVRESTDLNTNGNGNSYIYMAFAEAPLVGSNGVTAKAR